MASIIYVGFFIICLLQSIKISQADWDEPPFFKPEPSDPALKFFEFNAISKRTNIILEEEVDHEVCIAILSYKGNSRPSIGRLSDDKTNTVLGAEVRLNESTNIFSLWITQRQDYETESMRYYRFSLVSESKTYAIALSIMNIDDNPPVIQALEKNCAIEENYKGLTNCSYMINDADGWIDQTAIYLTSVPEGHNFQFVNSTDLKSEYKRKVFLNVIKSLDFENISMYMLQIRAIDGAKHEINLEAIVKVIDMPDMPPVWTQITAAEYVLEKSTKKFKVSAIDGDIQINAEINYMIEVNDKNDTEYFVVNKTTGEITINKIDRDKRKQEIFRFHVIAYEQLNSKSKINATIVVIVDDVNDNAPKITPDVIEIKIDEEKYTTLEFKPPILIEDPDLAENAQFSVSLTDKSAHHWSSAFLVVPTSGYQSGIFTISVANATLLDYENENWRVIDIQLRAIEVQNASHIGTSNIHIKLNNLNDELPIFDANTPSIVSIPEDVEKSFPIATVHATDRDIGDKVTHSLVAQRTLTINETTGKIITNRANALDYETMPVVVVQVVATDLANHKTYTTLTINVMDVNDVPPELYLPTENPTLVEESPTGTVVKAFIKAEDVDTNAELIFSIDWTNTRAQKNSVEVKETLYRKHLNIRTDWPVKQKNKTYAEGTLYVADRIDYEKFDIIFLTISVTDEKTKHNKNTTSATLTLHINDINDNWPVFDEPIEKMDVMENQVKDAMIGTITAKDADGREFNNVTYGIKPINNTEANLVTINSLSGIIKVGLDKKIDAEVYEFIYYNVTATDGYNTNWTTIAIYVIDQNDMKPYTLDKEFNSTIHIPEKSPSGTPIIRVRGEDKDRTSPFNNVSYLINEKDSASMDYFSMGKFDGFLQVNLTDGYTLDRDRGPSEYTLNLKLRDNYLIDHVTTNTNEFDFSVTVILEDINDKDPILPDLGDPAQIVSENTKKDGFIREIVADDRDDPNTNNTKVFYVIKSISPAEEKHVVINENYKNLFYVKTRNNTAAQIFANYDLKGYYGRWIIELYVHDFGEIPGPRNCTKNYVIQVKDYNYNTPEIQFPNIKKLPLNKNQKVHEQLITYDNQSLSDFRATDKDFGDSGNVTFSIDRTTGDHESFEIVPISTNVARLRLSEMIDVETKNSYTLTLIAKDHGDPHLQKTQELTVIFITSGPQFVPNKWTAWIKENKTGLDTNIKIPAARDMAGEIEGHTLDIYYFINSDGKDAKYFALDKVNRNLTVIKELDRENQDIMIFEVIATPYMDGPLSDSQTRAILEITIIVVDENDNPPIFETDIYRAGVAMEDSIDKVVLTVKATDVDLNDTLRYSINLNSTTTFDSSLKKMDRPFSINSMNGDLMLNFTVTSNMNGFFKFNIIVHDEVKHNDTTTAQIYVVPQSSRVVFIFNNLAIDVKNNKLFVIESFSTAYGYTCNIDDIKSTVDTNDQILNNSTTVTTHFISPKNNLPIKSNAIIISSSDLKIITNLKATLLTRSLYLTDVPTESSTITTDGQQIVHWILVSLTIFFCLCSTALLVVYVIRMRRMRQTLDKLAITKFGSQESGLDRTGVVPTTNQFAQAGSNPMWNTLEKSIDDNVSQGSGDSDLIGIENNPDFGYINNAMMNSQQWEDTRRDRINPVFANGEVTSGDAFDWTSHKKEEKNNIHHIY